MPGALQRRLGKLPLPTASRRNVAPFLWSLHDFAADILLAFVDFMALGSHIPMIYILETLLDHSQAWEVKGVLSICRSDSDQVDLQAPVTCFSASAIAMPRYC
jgi:hypothetical protein